MIQNTVINTLKSIKEIVKKFNDLRLYLVEIINAIQLIGSVSKNHNSAWCTRKNIASTKLYRGYSLVYV